LHWISAGLIVFGLAHGYWMTHFLPRSERLFHYGWHAQILVYLGLLVAIRIVWRLSEPSPAQPKESARWERAAAHIGHVALYLVLIASLATGYLLWSSFPGRFNPDPKIAAQLDLTLLPGFKVPAIHEKVDRTVSKFWEELHEKLAWGMLALILLHVAAALRHKFVKRNNVMARMWPGRVT
jgi:cytochrome b561